MQSFVLIDQDLLNNLLESIKDLKEIVLCQKENTKNATDWITLSEFFITYNISRSSWDRKYKKIIKYRDDGTKIWVHVPSMEKYLMDKSIN